MYFRTYNTDRTVETQDYGVQSGDVSQTMPMLGMYYYFMGMYAIYISSDSDSSESSITSSSEDEGEYDQTTSNRTNNPGNSFY